MRTLQLILYGLLLSGYLTANTSPSSLFDSFEQEDALHLTIETNFERILSSKKVDDYQAARFSYEKNGEEVEWDIKVKQRGKYRRRVCDMPPLKLNFSEKDLVAAGLADFDKMKLVSHCLNDASARNTVLKEYLAYKMYNELTPYSFRVQLVKITYIDTKRSMRKIKQYGFLIESTSELEHRIGAQELETIGLSTEQIHTKQAALASEFQYLIANSDWDITALRNVKLLQKTGEPALVVPYDFDFSGLVAAPYAIPNRSVGQKQLQQRVYMGAAEANRASIQTYFSKKQSDLYAVIQNFGLFSWTVKDEMISYLDTYFQIPESKDIPVETPVFRR